MDGQAVRVETYIQKRSYLQYRLLAKLSIQALVECLSS